MESTEASRFGITTQWSWNLAKSLKNLWRVLLCTPLECMFWLDFLINSDWWTFWSTISKLSGNFHFGIALLAVSVVAAICSPRFRTTKSQFSPGKVWWICLHYIPNRAPVILNWPIGSRSDGSDLFIDQWLTSLLGRARAIFVNIRFRFIGE